MYTREPRNRQKREKTLGDQKWIVELADLLHTKAPGEAA